jgi:hypothetical protein
MGPVRAGLLALAMWALGCACARAESGVIMRERDGLRPGLCGALRIQLSGAAEVTCEPEDGSDLLSDRISAAAARVRELDARLAVLVERDPDPGRVRMYIVSAEKDQAVVAIERIEDRPDPDVDRSLALKVRDAYEVVEVVEKTAPASAAPLSAALASPAAKRAHQGVQLPAFTPSTEPSWLMFLDAGGGVSLGTRQHGLAALALGIGQLAPGWRAELGLGARFASRSQEVQSFGHINVLARGPELSLRLLWRSARIEVGGALQGMVWFLRGEGVAADGSRGERTRLVPSVSLGPDLRVRLFSSAFLRIAPAAEVAFVSQRFAVEDFVLVDEGRVRFVLPVSLLLALPLGPEPESLRP